MRIGLFIPTLSVGGAERSAQFLGDVFSKKGHEVFYFVIRRGSRIFSVNGTVVYTGIEETASDLGMETITLLEGAIKLRCLKRKFKIDIMISFMGLCNFINILSKGNEKVVVRMATTLSYWSSLRGIIYQKNWIKKIYRHADQVVAVSNYTKVDLVDNYGIDSSKVLVIPNPALIRKQSSALDQWEYGNKAIVCVGRLEPVKQYERTIRAFTVVRNEIFDAKLVIIGDGKIRDYLRMTARDCNVEDSVIFMGHRNNLGFYMSHARALVVSSEVEGFPNVVVEAMACGTPVISTDSPGGCGEIVGKQRSSDEVQYCKYGILTPYISGRVSRNAELNYGELCLGNAIKNILEDDKLYERYSKSSLKRAEYYSADRIINIWSRLIGE